MSAPRKGGGQKKNLGDNRNLMASAVIRRAQPTALASQRRDVGGARSGRLCCLTQQIMCPAVNILPLGP